MKANCIVVLTAISTLFSELAFGQISTFSFNNGDPGQPAPVFDSDGMPLGPDFRAELWGSATPGSLIPAYDLFSGSRVIVPFFGDGYEGYFYSAESFLAVPAQVFDGGNSWLQVRAWDSRLGSTYEEVAALNIGGYGESPLFYADGANPYLVNPEAPRPLIGLESFSLRPVVPEPSTWALLALGALALMWTRPGRRR